MGTIDDVGNEGTPKLLKESIQKQSKRPISVTTTIVKGADHMYFGQQLQVTDVITK